MHILQENFLDSSHKKRLPQVNIQEILDSKSQTIVCGGCGGPVQEFGTCNTCGEKDFNYG